MKPFIILFIALFWIGMEENFAQTVPSSEEKKDFAISLEGMLGFSVGKDFYSMNVGGPALFLNLNPDLKIGLGAFPSLYLLNGNLGARLGVAPRIDYKNLVFFAPFFHKEASDTWIGSVGMGYKFHKKAK
ncbi:hypothetical protein CLV31_13017 [Algoriphagus aquaeductus]|uniref:Outer membrane protein with beta-barrel domain n=1 Tax=Algoriphagus aquaeductus TaxID=475299 RepID=A0A326RJP3_9BACT|nr:hypothetical protein [Algoriphagus aquaeductus]PZV75761.1 hypothetical protein CLV31_13017 [Algoriphagus aquaeductus]